LSDSILSNPDFLPHTAMVLAAGLGKRMRPITDTIPKPLVRVAGKPLIDWGLDHLVDAGVQNAVVNVHYLADQIEAHLAGRNGMAFQVSDEREALLESGGGIIKALPLLGADPFFLINSDTFWLDEGEANLVRLAKTFDIERMDILLMLAAHEQATGHGAKSDFIIAPGGRLARYTDGGGAGYIYAGAAILHPRIFAGVDDDAHSLNREFNTAIDAGRLYGMPMRGQWITVGTPDAIEPAEAIVAAFGKKP
jgi:N-acetyl-alpha-D-muramate 1-phosphate uridylyltransferase